MVQLIFTEEQTDRWVYYESDTFWRLKQMLDAVETAKTWGEFRSMLPEGEFEKLGQWVVNGGEQIYLAGSEYFFIEADELPRFLDEAKGDEDYFIIRHDSSFDNSWFTDACWPDFESQVIKDFPEDFVERFQTGTTWVLSKPAFSEDDYDEMEKVLVAEGFEVSNIGTVW